MKREIIFSLILLFILLHSASHAQIPINGFCKVSAFDIKNGYSRIFDVDYNSDGFRDLVISNPSTNSYQALTGETKNIYSRINNKYSSISISAIQPIGKRFLALSQKNRELSLISFKRSGALSVFNKIKLDGYGTFISSSKIDESGKNGILVTGTALNGIVLLREWNGRIKEEEIIKGKIFSSGLFIDLNYDSYSDIAAFDLLSNSIVMFYNNQAGEFEESRSIGLQSEIKEFRSTDFNLDRFTDLAFIRNGKLEILLGDSVSSFHKKIVFSGSSSIGKYSIFDFNGDGYNDVAFLNSDSNTLEISFGKGGNLFFDPVVYFSEPGLTDLTSFVDRGGRKLACLSSNGKVIVLSTITFAENQFSISASEHVSAIQSFDLMNDGHKDFCFYDEAAGSLKILQSERRNLFRILYSYPISTHVSKIIVGDQHPTIKTFYCYSKGSSTIEILRIDFGKNKFSRLFLYTLKQIDELKINADRLKDWQTIAVLTKENKKRYLQLIELRNFRQASSSEKEIGDNIECASFTFNIYKDVYSVTRSGNKINVMRTILDKKIIESTPRVNFDLGSIEMFSAATFCIDQLFIKSKPGAAILTMKNKSVLYLFVNNKNYRFALSKRIATQLSVRYLIEGEDRFSILCLNDYDKKFYRIKIRLGDRAADVEDVRISGDVKNFILTKIDGRADYVVSLSRDTNNITFKKL